MDKISKLKEKADGIFRKLLHERHGEFVVCPTCGESYPNKEMTVGHAFKRNDLPVRWDFRFADLQCWTCNISEMGGPKMCDYLSGKYANWWPMANELRRQLWTRWDIEHQIEKMKSAKK
jgi:hypothetical protein